MGQKTHPTGFRVGIIQKWASTWFAKAKDYREFVAEDAKIRKFVKKKLYAAGISKIWIARKGDKITITVQQSRVLLLAEAVRVLMIFVKMYQNTLAKKLLSMLLKLQELMLMHN